MIRSLDNAAPSEIGELIEDVPEGASIALCQLDSRWLDSTDKEVQRLRAEIDRSIYQRLLADGSHSISVSRILAYDPPSDIEPSLHRELVAEKRRWQSDLFRQQALLGEAKPLVQGSADVPRRRVISIRLFVFGRAGQVDRLPQDCLDIASSENEISESFREVWNLPRVFGEARGFREPAGLRDPESLILDLGKTTS